MHAMMGGVCLSVRSYVCRVPLRNREWKGLWKPKIGRMEAVTRDPI